MNKILMGTIALEVNRWGSRMPSYLVSEWIPKFRADGFDGIELWENHVLLSEGEAEKIKASGFPVGVYNTYAGFSDSDEDKAARAKAAEMINFFGAGAVKYNVGNDYDLLEVYKENVLRFAESLHKDCTLMCECHDGTVFEDNLLFREVFNELCPEKFAIVMHPFVHPMELELNFDNLCPRIAHIHSQLSKDGKRVRLDRWPERVDACFKIMKKFGFAGGFTVEFTELTAEPGENIDDLYANAVLDYKYIKEAFG